MPSNIQIAAAAALLVVACGGPESPDPGARPNVLCVVIDTLRADHLGLYGHARPTTPALDRLAARSLVVESMVAQSSWTKPSVASIFTGLLPSQHRAVQESTSNHLADGLVTLAELLQSSGYLTGGISENPHIGPSTGFDQGFEQFQTLNGFGGNLEWVLARSQAWLARAAAQERPFFLYVHILDPHGPYEPAAGPRSELVLGTPPADERVRDGMVGQLVEGTRMLAELSPADLDWLRALYDAELRGTDGAIAELLATLGELGLEQDTIVLLTSDHGEEFLDHGTLKHGYQLYRETTRVPLILHVPGAAPRRESEVVVQHVDLAPTLLELVGLPVPGHFHGRSLAGLVRGETYSNVPAVSQTEWRGVDVRAVQLDGWKLIVDARSGERLLFDLARDPLEREDLAAREPARVEALAAVLERELERAAAAALDETTGAGDPEAEKALRALGYFGK